MAMANAFVINASRTQESAAITKRRQVDAHYGKYENIKRDDGRLLQRANWEINSAKMIERNAVSNLARDLEAAEKKKLQVRRAKLTAMYRSDEQRYKQDLFDLRETSEQKAKRMVRNARKLKADRENKRKAFAQEMYNRQWREACDDLRLIGTESFAAHCNQEIALQREEKARRNQHRQREEQAFANTWEAVRQQRVEEENEKQRARQRDNHVTKLALLDQMEDVRQSKLKQAHETELEREAFRRQMEEDTAFAAQCARENEAEQKRRMDDIIAFNQATNAAKSEVARIQREEELQDLGAKLESHRKDLEAKRNRKAALRRDTQAYMAYLAQQREEMRRFEMELNQLTWEEQERANAKRDAQWQKDADKRNQLFEDVYRGRAMQLAEIAEKHRQLEAELEMERQVVLAEAANAKEYEFKEEEEFRRKEIKHQQDLIRQMQEKRNVGKMEAAMVIEDRENSVEAERQYRAFVERERNLAKQKGAAIHASSFQ